MLRLVEAVSAVKYPTVEMQLVCWRPQHATVELDNTDQDKAHV